MTNSETMEHINSNKLLDSLTVSKLRELAEKTGLDPLNEVPYYILGKISQRLDTLTDMEKEVTEFTQLCDEVGNEIIKSIRGKSIEEQESEIHSNAYKVVIKAFTKGYIQAVSDYDTVINK